MRCKPRCECRILFQVGHSKHPTGGMSETHKRSDGCPKRASKGGQMSRAEYGGNRAGMTYHGNDRQAEVDNIKMGILRAYPHPNLTPEHAEMIAEYLIENPMGKPVRSKDGFELDSYDLYSEKVILKPIDYKEEA